jgi:hypothetical protein
LVAADGFAARNSVTYAFQSTVCALHSQGTNPPAHCD